jgi:MFS family permease
VLKAIRKIEYVELMGLFFLQGAALGMWLVPLSRVLDSHGLQAIKPFAYAANGVAAFVSPLIFGAMADRRASPARVLRGLALATAGAMALASAAIQGHWSPWVVLGVIQLHALCSAPTFSIATTIILSQLVDARQEFGPIRATATLGWLAGCCLVSLLGVDASTGAGFTGACTWLLVAGFTYFLPALEVPLAVTHLTWHERLGLDALSLLKNPDHRAVFLTVALFSMPLAGFYPYAPPHLRELGFYRTSAWMSLGQVSEIIAMLCLGRLLLKWRLKWILACGLAFGVLRYALSAMNRPGWLLAGVALHGFSFTLVSITAQIYLDQRIEPAWRARGQALLTLMSSGVGNLCGYLGTGVWFGICGGTGHTQWRQFWLGLAAAVGLILVGFLLAYHGRGSGFHQALRKKAEGEAHVHTSEIR